MGGVCLSGPSDDTGAAFLFPRILDSDIDHLFGILFEFYEKKSPCLLIPGEIHCVRKKSEIAMLIRPRQSEP